MVLTSVVWPLSVGYVFPLSLFQKLFINVYVVCFIRCFIVKLTMGKRSCFALVVWPDLATTPWQLSVCLLIHHVWPGLATVYLFTISFDKVQDGAPMIDEPVNFCILQDKSLNTSVNLQSAIVIKVSYDR